MTAPSATGPQQQSHPAGAAPRLVLASASPRRRELIGVLAGRYEAQANDAEDSDDPVPADVLAALPQLELPLANHPTLLAWRKASHAAALAPGAVVLGADTIVVIDGDVLNKPADAAHARQMLARLSGRVHTVYTGLCVIAAGDGPADGRARCWLDLVPSEVELAPLSADAIAAYVKTGEPMDKAGAYGIQGLGGNLVRAVRGSYTAVVGLPLTQTHALLRAAGIADLDDPERSYRRWLQQQGKEPLPCPPTLP